MNKLQILIVFWFLEPISWQPHLVKCFLSTAQLQFGWRNGGRMDKEIENMFLLIFVCTGNKKIIKALDYWKCKNFTQDSIPIMLVLWKSVHFTEIAHKPPTCSGLEIYWNPHEHATGPSSSTACKYQLFEQALLQLSTPTLLREEQRQGSALTGSSGLWAPWTSVHALTPAGSRSGSAPARLKRHRRRPLGSPWSYCCLDFWKDTTSHKQKISSVSVQTSHGREEDRRSLFLLVVI